MAKINYYLFSSTNSSTIEARIGDQVYYYSDYYLDWRPWTQLLASDTPIPSLYLTLRGVAPPAIDNILPP